MVHILNYFTILMTLIFYAKGKKKLRYIMLEDFYFHIHYYFTMKANYETIILTIVLKNYMVMQI